MRALPVLLFLVALAASAYPQDAKPLPTLAAKTAGMKHLAGFLPLDWDARTGHLYLELHLDAAGLTPDLLYTNSLPYGTGSNDLGLDRGQTARGLVVRFQRIGPKVLLVESNQGFRSSSHDPAEQLAVTQSFPSSVLFGFTVAAEDSDGIILVDATDLFLRDVHNVADTLTREKQGTYKVDASRSAVAIDATRAFPNNTEVEAVLTFTTDAPPTGKYVRDVTPDPHALTVRERSSFVELPALDGSFTPRRFDPRSGYFDFSYRDYTAPLGDDITQRFIERHRLIKRDPTCTKSCEAVTPIQYYVDRGAPEPVRSALLEGARWWDTAFQAAGWAPGTFRVDLLPADADPMDVRYNIIQWVHRYTRGWSYGETVTDPRTGEILKGNVTLGSLRGRQDYMIAEALLAPYDSSWNVLIERGESITGPSEHPSVTPINPMMQMVLARIRQLAAHETGHTLGLAHNFAASTVSQGDSVMDYPHPYVTLSPDGKIDISHAYATGIGAWDKVAIDYGYREFDINKRPTEDTAALHQILTDADKSGQLFLSDDDARPYGSASPRAHLWDNGADPVAELNRVLAVRATALKNFGEAAIKPGVPLAQLEQTLVPLYLFHRYQTEAAIKVIGGLDYRYNLRGDGQPLPAFIPLAVQNQAIAAVMKTLAPDTLTLPDSILRLLPPVPPGYPRTQESLPSETGLTFDPVAAAEAAADLTLQVLLDPARASRIVEYHMGTEHPGPSLRVLMEDISKTTAERTEGGHTISSEVERAVEFRGLEWMLALAVNPQASTQSRAIARYHLEDLLHQWTTTPPPTDSAEAIHRTAMIERINDFKRDPEKFVPAKPIDAPPGMPIGDDEDAF